MKELGVNLVRVPCGYWNWRVPVWAEKLKSDKKEDKVLDPVLRTG